MTIVKSSRARLSLRTSCRRFALAALAVSGLALLGGAAADAAERATARPVLSALAVDSPAATAGTGVTGVALADWPWEIPPVIIKPKGLPAATQVGGGDWPWNIVPTDWPWSPGGS